MGLTEKINCGIDLLKAKILNRRMPFAVSWHLTYRCNYHCKYCDIPLRTSFEEELSTEDIFVIINDLHEMGTRRIHFCGGECLLRDDLGEIIDYCKKKSIQTGLISNGALVPDNIDKLKNLHILKLSLDGPPYIQDKLRGNGAYARVMAAVKAAKSRGMNVFFNTTLNRINLKEIEFILEKSRELDVPVKFSPLNHVHADSKNISELLLPIDSIKRRKNFLKSLASEKYVVNSAPALNYIASFPKGNAIIPCVAGRFFCHIKPNGDVYPCERKKLSHPLNCKRDGTRKAFDSLPTNYCDQCWCTSTLELNFIYHFNIKAILNTLKNNL